MYSKLYHLYIICSKCPPPVQTQARRHWCHVANSTFNNRFIQISLLDASFQFIDIREVPIGGGHFEYII